jgi:hypothetical protein
MNSPKNIIALLSLVALLAAGIDSTTFAQEAEEAQVAEMPEMPAPQKEHEWLQRFEGEWTSMAECVMGPDEPPMKCEGTQTARILGGFWMIAEGSAEAMSREVRSVMTIGYDPAKKHYVGTWTDSCNSHMWIYEGTLNDEGTKLTLNTEGPNMMLEGKMSKYRETIEFKSDDHYVFTSSMQGDDGEWIQFMTADYRRAK